MTSTNLLRHLTTGFVIATSTFAAAAEAGTTTNANKALPGVEGNYSIVRPAMPEPDTQAEDTSKNFKVGNTEVHIGGSVRVDIQAGSLSAPHR